MSEKPHNTPSTQGAKQAKQERLEKALRANLMRRKQASAERKAGDDE